MLKVSGPDPEHLRMVSSSGNLNYFIRLEVVNFLVLYFDII